MKDMFDKVFEEVMNEKNINDWYVLYDSDDFDEVIDRISKLLGYDCWENEEFGEWEYDMAMDL